ncbi:hypothetical protein DSO57_1003413 [Entomophthora muscae]|uniref:Uncharacterized protein n=1 Tax=Entomophthora muscae TaxID=34485 RepID=A0ACC2TJE3_9FUNG|nr:hypothetical protein DSO57_1003413 [Entomophthora muscae]
MRVRSITSPTDLAQWNPKIIENAKFEWDKTLISKVWDPTHILSGEAILVTLTLVWSAKVTQAGGPSSNPRSLARLELTKFPIAPVSSNA